MEQPKRYHDMRSGFTLIEILVVLIIISIVSVITVLSFGDFGHARQQRLSLLQFKASLQSAQLNAVLQHVVLGITITSTGYRYTCYQSNPKTSMATWIPLSHDYLSDMHAFHATSWSLNTSIQTAQNQPSIYVLPDGSITPFRWRITFNHEQTFQIVLNQSGALTIATV